MNSKSTTNAMLSKRVSPDSKVRGNFSPLLVISALAGLIFAVSAPLAIAQTNGPSLSSFADQSRNRFKPLSLEQAFPFHLSVAADSLYRANWETAPEHYLYQNKLKFSYQQNASTPPQLLEVELPVGVEKTDEFFGDVEVYFSHLSVDLNLPANPTTESVLIIEYQGCAEWGFCYPPQKVSMPLI
ncbi:MAG: protein-disulfide reductase DsbD domain-containing protein [Pseudohongiellaceae bacterium]